MIRLLTSGFLTAILFIPSVSVYSQVITDIPPNERNSRFLEDPSVITMRPGLSIAGFSNDGSVGLGLQELLNRAFESSGSSERESVVQILSIARESISLNPPVDQVIRTTNILQYLAFESLASLLLEQNGISSQQSMQDYGLEIREHPAVMDEFRTALVSLADNNKLVNKESGNDPFEDYLKSVRSYNNVARALDLYLAIENAYQYFNPAAEVQDLLLTENEKTRVMDRFLTDIDILFNDGLKAEYNFGGTFTATEDELEAGNRPLMGYLALGYASMSVQTKDPGDREKLDGYTAMTLARAGNQPSDDPRENYWMYQTGNGNRFWAEGPYYFDLVLKDAIIFWHAIRIHEGLESSSDPFTGNWFLNPVRWLSGLSTPAGEVPPTDDGNKRAVQAVNLLNWSDDYGDAEIGRTFKYLYDSVLRFHDTAALDEQYYLVEAAIPDSEEPGNAPRSITDPEEQQIVLRRPDLQGREHYIYLNGEKGSSITSGEGHEQPDQLQLLYYVDEYSFLADPGYDTGAIQSNSFRNGYAYTNTMQYDAAETRTTLGFVTYQNEGGLESPFASLSERRLVSSHSEAVLQVDESVPGVDLVSGQVELEFENPEPSSSTYSRSVLVVKGDHPYLIDINDILASSGRRDFVMRYYGNSDRHASRDGWFYWDVSDRPYTSPSDRLFLYTVPLVGSYTGQNDTVSILEYENRGGSEGEKQPYPVVRKSYYSSGDTDRFVTASILSISENDPLAEPVFVSGDQGLSYFIHTVDTETVDVFVFAEEPSDTTRTFTPDSEILSGIQFELESNQSIGFTRLIRSGGLWTEDPNHSLHLKPTSIPEEEPDDKPDEFALFHAYPNPLQTSTTVQYQLPELARVSLQVYDLLGRRVSSFSLDDQGAGTHFYTWDASGVSSGIYFLRFTAESASGGSFEESIPVSVLK